MFQIGLDVLDPVKAAELDDHQVFEIPDMFHMHGKPALRHLYIDSVEIIVSPHVLRCRKYFHFPFETVCGDDPSDLQII